MSTSRRYNSRPRRRPAVPAETWTEELFATGEGGRNWDANTLDAVDPHRSRGMVKVKRRNGTLLGLIGSRWCKVTHRDGRLVEVFTD
jgi:hypothetical protein